MKTAKPYGELTTKLAKKREEKPENVVNFWNSLIDRGKALIWIKNLRYYPTGGVVEKSHGFVCGFSSVQQVMKNVKKSIHIEYV